MKKREELEALRIPLEARTVRRKPWVWVVVVVLGVVTLVVTIRFLRHSKPWVSVVEAQAATGAGRPVVLNASGYVTPRRRATVAAKVTARVLEVRVEEGMRVEAGDVLAVLDASDAQKRLATAEAQVRVHQAAIQVLATELAEAERALDRQEKLRVAGVTSQQALDQAKTRVESLRAQLRQAEAAVRLAQAQVEQARQDVDNCIVRAPFAGIVVSKDAQPGEMVSPISAGGGFTRTGIATLVDMDSLEIEVDVNESYIARIRPGQTVEATLDAYPEWKIPATVRTVIPTADRQKATVKVRIALGVRDTRVLPDMGVKVAFLGEGENDFSPRVSIPAKALYEEAGQSAVYVLREGRLERRAVRVAERRADQVLLESGLLAGELVVVEAGGVLKDGMSVRVRR
ncbi:MAG: efflux RND transporter periplasmic adaptor subunit [Acidobacteria bacterium]|nr:efflux RND transporter periplasmic adaptor subunit [Acidobacteriota bacterium]MDW7985189.1 efflux RND transporter periplasmic adaptor subunit [Acidobacteriota bacterium]